MNPLAVYIHIPFCVRVCGYCDFNAYAGMDELKGAYAEAVATEIAAWAPVFADRTVTSIAFGGGTPGEMAAAEIAAMIDAIRAVAPVLASAEISLEANPGTTAGADLDELAAAGVNRISFGAQSFAADELAFLDRIHTPEASAASLALAREAGIRSVNLDLMYGLPGQTLLGWEETVVQALALAPDHLSMYALTVEPGTPLAGRVERGEVVPADPDLVADMYEAADERAEAAGLAAYELSNWALPQHESRHNRVYWTYGDYVGIGAGAHGFIGGERFENIAHPRAYIDAVKRSGRAIETSYRPQPETAVADWLALRLRFIEGFAPAEFRAQFGQELEAVVGEPTARCLSAGLLKHHRGRLRLTGRGRLLHSEVAVQMLTHLQQAPLALAD